MNNKLNSDLYNPLDMIIKIQRMKFKSLIPPIFIIISGFLIYTFLKIEPAKYLSLAGLLLYAFISMQYHCRKNVPPRDENVILSPVNGKVIKVDQEQQVVIIKKNIFNPADVRRPSDNPIITFSIFSTKFVMLDHQTRLAGKLIGIMPGSALCNCLIPDDYSFKIKIKQKVISGETILAQLSETNDQNDRDSSSNEN